MRVGKDKIVSFIVLIIMIILIITPYKISQAQSAQITFSTDSTDIMKGDNILVSIQITSDAVLGDFEAYITYNADILEFKNGATFISGGEGLLKLSDINVVNADSSRKYVMKFNAKEIGNCDIVIKDKANVYDYESGEKMSVSSNRLSIEVEATKEASTNTNLKSLKISPDTLSPGFDPKITEYSAKVPNNVEQLIVSSIPEDDTSTIALEGNENLTVGSNNITITVTAESGDQKIYKIKVIREEAADVEENSSESADNNQDLSETEYNNNETNITTINKIVLLKDGNDLYLQNGFRYRIVEPKVDTVIPQGYIKTTLKINEDTIAAYTPEHNLESDFLLIYASNEFGSEGFYQYDRVENTLQRYTKSQIENSSNKYVRSNEVIQSEKYKNNLTTMAIIIAVLGSISLVLSIVLIRLFIKEKE
jgi:hypothetical protein